MKAVITDLDGTICDLRGRDPYNASNCQDDLPHYEVIDFLDTCKNVIILTGRSEEYRQQTEWWLEEYDVKYKLLIMRPAGDFRRADIFKKEVYGAQISPHYEIELVIEDDTRVIPMWQRKGLNVRQVYKGEFREIKA